MKKCKSKLSIGGDHGDGCATMHCQLEEGHDGSHQERYDANSIWINAKPNIITVTWEYGDDVSVEFLDE